MFTPLRHAAYRSLFSAQVAALLGTGLATVALSLLAHDIAGANAGEILGAVLAIKMTCYVAVAPVASALAARLPRKTLLVGLDLVRAGIAVCLPFVSEPWQVRASTTRSSRLRSSARRAQSWRRFFGPLMKLNGSRIVTMICRLITRISSARSSRTGMTMSSMICIHAGRKITRKTLSAHITRRTAT